MSKTFTFGRMVVDKRHQFFGKADPEVFVIADMWADEAEKYEDGSHGEVMVDHYRGHFRIKFDDLFVEKWYEPLGFVDPSSEISVHDQCTAARDEWLLAQPDSSSKGDSQ